MMTHDTETYKSYLDVRAAAEKLLFAYASEDAHTKQHHLAYAIRELTEAAERLGFDLVKREQKQEAA